MQKSLDRRTGNSITHLFSGIFVVALYAALGFPGLARAGDAALTGGSSRYNSIVRPAYQNRVKHYLRLENSIRGLVVYELGSGMSTGSSEEIIATVNTSKSSPPIKFVNKVGPDVMVAAHIALRAVRLRYPKLQPGCIRLSFSDQYLDADGNSAGCACAILILSLLENTRLDRQMAITGAITADWRVRAIGGVADKIHGAIEDHLTGVVLPQRNIGSISDMMILDGPQRAWKIQIFTVRTLQEAMALMQRNKPRDISYAMLLFSTLQPKFDRMGIGALRDPDVLSRLKQITALAPNDISAQYLLAVAAGKQLRKLSLATSEYKAFDIISGYKNYLWKFPPPAMALLKAPIRNTMRRLSRLSEIAAPRSVPLIEALRRFIRTCGNWAGSPPGVIHIEARRDAVMTALDRLNSNKRAIDRLLRNGF